MSESSPTPVSPASVTVFASPKSWIESDLHPGKGAPIGAAMSSSVYKRIEQVIDDLVTHGLATTVATTVPLLTYKTPDGPHRARSERGHRRGDRRRS